MPLQGMIKLCPLQERGKTEWETWKVDNELTLAFIALSDVPTQEVVEKSMSVLE